MSVWPVGHARENVIQEPSKRVTLIQSILKSASDAEHALTPALWELSLQ